MKKIYILNILIFCNLFISAQTAKDILPASEWQEGWIKENVQAYEGDDLFFLINGGADLYMEFGFIDVAAAEYSHPEKGKFYVEIYKMESDSSAFGAFTMNRGAFIKLEPSPWIIYRDRFMIVWAGEYYITISGVNFNKEGLNIDYLLLIASLTSASNFQNKLPVLFEELYYSKKPENIAYLMGHIALNNIYSFGFQDIFNVREAVVFDYRSYKEIIFQYETNDIAEETFSEVRDFMKDSGRFYNYLDRTEDLFFATDRTGRTLTVDISGNRINVKIK